MKKPNNTIEVLIATRIMGWNWSDNGLPDNRNFQHWQDEDGKDMGWYFSPQESMESAWKVVSKVSSRTYYYAFAWAQQGQLFANFSRDKMKGAFASLAETGGDKEKAQCLAICRAAWKSTYNQKVPF